MANEYWYEKEIDELIGLITKISDKQDLKKLFGRILTPREINDMAKRLKIWEMLEEGKSYADIQMAIKTGPVLISKVANQIGFGFRRSSIVITKRAKNPKQKKPHLKYKGASSILDLLP